MDNSNLQILNEIALNSKEKEKDRIEAGQKLLNVYLSSGMFQEIREISFSKGYTDSTRKTALELLPKSIYNYINSKNPGLLNFTFALEMQDIMFLAGKNDPKFLQIFSDELLSYLSKKDKTICLFEAVMLSSYGKINIDKSFLENLSKSLDLNKTKEIIDELFIAEKFVILGTVLNGLEKNCPLVSNELQAIREKKKNFLLSITDKYAKDKNLDKLEEIALSELDQKLCNYAVGLLIDALSKSKSIERLERLAKMQFSEPVLERIKNTIKLLKPSEKNKEDYFDLSEKGLFEKNTPQENTNQQRKKQIL